MSNRKMAPSGKLSFLSESLYANSVFLIMSTGMMAFFGFIFWLINSKLYTAESLGIAAALIPAANIIALASLFGLDASLVRFLANHPKPKEVVLSSFFVVLICSILFGIVFGITTQYHSPTIELFFNSIYNYAIFITLITSTSLNLMCDAVYLSNKKSLFTLVATIFFSALKAVFPLLFISYGANGIIIAAATAQSLGLVLNLTILQYKWKYFSEKLISFTILLDTWKYTTSNYIANIFNLLPASIIPLLIINKIGSAEAAYYYIVMMVANLLYVVSYATTKSLFAEGSYTTDDIISKIKQTVKFISIITLPAIILLWFSANLILLFFGTDYSINGSNLLKIAGATAIPISIYAICVSIFRIRKNTFLIILNSMIYAIFVISLTFYYVKDGLDGVGLAWFIANTLSALFALFLLFVFSKPGTITYR